MNPDGILKISSQIDLNMCWKKRCTRFETLQYEFINISNLFKYCQSLSSNALPLGSALKLP